MQFKTYNISVLRSNMTHPVPLEHQAASVRELREETGYEGENPRLIGRVLPNPAIMSNLCSTVMVENCRCLHRVQFDHGEDLVTRLVPIADGRDRDDSTFPGGRRALLL